MNKKQLIHQIIYENKFKKHILRCNINLNLFIVVKKEKYHGDKT